MKYHLYRAYHRDGMPVTALVSDDAVVEARKEEEFDTLLQWFFKAGMVDFEDHGTVTIEEDTIGSDAELYMPDMMYEEN